MLSTFARAVQAQCLVGVQFADNAVAGSDDSDSQDNAKRDELRWDSLQCTQALGDGVCCSVKLVLAACAWEWFQSNECEPDCSSFCDNVSIHFFTFGWVLPTGTAIRS